MGDQLDMLFSKPVFYTVPPNVSGRIMADDFISFNLPSNFPSNRYQVVLEGLNTSSDVFRSMGAVQSTMRVPHIQLPSFGSGLVALLPDSDKLPRFVGQFARGATYTVPSQTSGYSTVMMTRHGVI